MKKIFLAIFVLCLTGVSIAQQFGKFNVGKDLFLAQFDCKTDVDDIYSIAGVATMLADPRFS